MGFSFGKPNIKTFSILFHKDGALNSGSFPLLSGVQCNIGSTNFVAPVDCFVSNISISKSDSNTSHLELIVDGSVVETIEVKEKEEILEFDPIAIDAGSRFVVRNKAGFLHWNDFICCVILEY
jgi:hypothetical protein